MGGVYTVFSFFHLLCRMVACKMRLFFMLWLLQLVNAVPHDAPLANKTINQENLSVDDREPEPPFSSFSVQGGEVRNFVSATLGSNMVLQRDRPAMIWGFSESGATITTFLQKGNSRASDPMTTTVDNLGVWRQQLPAQSASKTPHTIIIQSTTGEVSKLNNILFGDVYICGGQSNMQFSIPMTTNATQEAQRANQYPHIRLFTVGQRTASPDRALMDLQTIEQPWSVANEESLGSYGDQSLGFGYFSSVCWFFGREISDGLENKVPIGLISSNWGGTKVEVWQPGGNLFNAMIYPYMVGPMAVTGFAWYQGEANRGNADLYAQNFPQMIRQWRYGFQVPDAYFGFVQLSTWCALPGIPEIRQAQMAALSLPMVGYATNADHGAGCNVHPPPKQYCGARLGKSALALQYGQTDIHWKSPSYEKAKAAKVVKKINGKNSTSHQVVIYLRDVTNEGIKIRDDAFNSLGGDFDCKAQKPGTCSWASIKMERAGWFNASISVQEPDQILLTLITSDVDKIVEDDDNIVETSYAWSPVPMMTIYDAGSDLPALPWKEKILEASPAPGWAGQTS